MCLIVNNLEKCYPLINLSNINYTVNELSFQVLKVPSHRDLLYLMNDKWTLKTTFAGAIIK